MESEKKKWFRLAAVVLLLLGLVLISKYFITGCGQRQTASSSSDVEKAKTDLANVATGLQSSGTSTSNSSSSIGGAPSGSSVKALGISIKHVTPDAWVGTPHQVQVYTNTWTSTSGATITETGSTALRALDASGNAVAVWTNPMLWPDVRTMEDHTHFTAAGRYAGEFSNTVTMPASFMSFPFTMSASGSGSIYFITTSSTFSVTSVSMTVNVSSETSQSGTGTMTWGYLAPGSTYAYYYGSLSMTLTAAGPGTPPSAMSGDVYQDLTNDGVNNGVVVGTITMDPSAGKITITLNDGTEIVAGSF